MAEEVSDRARLLMKSLVELYVREGQPVGSKALADSFQNPISSATVRNVMAELEQKGFVKSPHTSAGRGPTTQGYRLFVDSLIKVEPLDLGDLSNLSTNLDPDMSSQELVSSASELLSEITHMAGLVTLPRREQVTLRHVDFLKLSTNRVLVILVLDDHEVQNRIIYTQNEYSDVQLQEAMNFINRNFAGHNMRSIRDRLINSMKSDRETMDQLMQTALEVAEKAFDTEEKSDFVVSGQENLFELAQDQALEQVRELFKAFSLKGDILELLDRCLESEGVQLFIGQESGYELLDECSLVTAPYEVDGELVGVLGVIGPTRMAYERVIPIVDATSRLLSAAMHRNLR